MLAEVWQWIKRTARRLIPQPPTWHGIGLAFQLAGWLLLVGLLVTMLSDAPQLGSVLAVLLIFGLTLLGVAGVWWALDLLTNTTPRFRFGLILLLGAALPLLTSVAPAGSLVLGVLLLLSLMMLGGGLASGRKFGWHWYNGAFAVLGGVGVLGLLVGFSVSGWQVEEDIQWQPMAGERIELADPGQPGPYAIKRLIYGPGTDPHRPEFGEAVDFVTAPVDGSKLIDGWSAGPGWARTRYWQASAEELPVRGRVYFPDGPGPFPLVLMVHGNHLMEDYSDAGYAYLGEHFASRGIVAISVDENFLNSSLSDMLNLMDGGLDEENDARGWLLLKHLSQLRAWNEQADHPWAGKLDLERVVLIGHSRGGEAVSEAAVFNRLSAYPDDATLAFNFNFGIRGIVAIAPVDHQYNPRSRATVPSDLNYLVLHGSHDGDVTSYAGSALYSRLAFDACQSCFKAGLYLLGANHGQFNSDWGRSDAPAPFKQFLNLAPIMDPQAQRDFASITIATFLQATFESDGSALAAMAAPERIHHQLPADVRYLSQFRAADDVVLADFEEDAEVASATRPGTRIVGRGLNLWQEREVPLKWRDLDSAAVELGWQAVDGEPAPSYQLQFDQPLQLHADSSLSVSLAMSGSGLKDVDEYEQPDEIDLSLRLVDASGREAVLPIASRRALLPAVEPALYKLELFNDDAASEVVFQRYRFPVAQWLAQVPELDLSAIVALSFDFVLTPSGVIWLDDVVVSPSGL